jgi:hypothetical protein
MSTLEVVAIIVLVDGGWREVHLASSGGRFHPVEILDHVLGKGQEE